MAAKWLNALRVFTVIATIATTVLPTNIRAATSKSKNPIDFDDLCATICSVVCLSRMHSVEPVRCKNSCPTEVCPLIINAYHKCVDGEDVCRDVCKTGCATSDKLCESLCTDRCSNYCSRPTNSSTVGAKSLSAEPTKTSSKLRNVVPKINDRI